MRSVARIQAAIVDARAPSASRAEGINATGLLRVGLVKVGNARVVNVDWHPGARLASHEDGDVRRLGARRAVYSISPWSTCRQFSQSPPSPPDCEGGGRAGQSLGASVGRPMADRIFLMVSSVSIMAMRRRGVLQRGQTVSMSNVFFRSWLQEI
jgi:hypothetical protein